ncbi:hypothetical protein [Martelella mangrovi]|uniref:Uncharacterized protein n=1 Tax=Martelella mangrovi TaxID=1397477 RepID=A0ABV2IG35_9HYPH
MQPQIDPAMVLHYKTTCQDFDVEIYFDPRPSLSDFQIRNTAKGGIKGISFLVKGNRKKRNINYKDINFINGINILKIENGNFSKEISIIPDPGIPYSAFEPEKLISINDDLDKKGYFYSPAPYSGFSTFTGSQIVVGKYKLIQKSYDILSIDGKPCNITVPPYYFEVTP